MMDTCTTQVEDMYMYKICKSTTLIYFLYRSGDADIREESAASGATSNVDQNFALSGKLTAETNTYRVRTLSTFKLKSIQ